MTSRTVKVKGKKAPTSSVDGVGWTLAVIDGERRLRCHRCGQAVQLALWWSHGADSIESPCVLDTERRAA